MRKAVEHRAIIAVIVETVDQLRMAARLLGMRAPDDALVQIGDPQAVIPSIELEEKLIQALGHVIDRAGIGGIEDLLADRVAACGFDADRR